MFVRKVKLMPSVFLAHAKTLERSPAKYPIRRVVCKSFTIPQNYLDVSHEKLFSGQLPTRIVIGLVDNRDTRGYKVFFLRQFRQASLCLPIVRAIHKP